VLPFGGIAQNSRGVYTLPNHVLAHLETVAGKTKMKKTEKKIGKFGKYLKTNPSHDYLP
jgi:hypothetical protein